MARIRTIKPEFWVDDVMVELPPLTRLLFIGIWNFVDDEGYIEAKPKRIKMQVFPADSFAPEDSLRALVETGRLIECSSDQGPLLKVANWERHQRISHPTATKFTNINELPRQNGPSSVSIPESSVNVPEPSALKGKEGKGTEGKGREGNRTGTALAALESDDVAEAFESAWSHWPKKDKKKPALSKFRTAAKKRGLDQITADVTRYGDAYQAAGTETRFIPGLETWLNQERWTDPLPQPSTPASTGHERAAARQAANMAVVEHFRNLEANTGTIWEIES